MKTSNSPLGEKFSLLLILIFTLLTFQDLKAANTDRNPRGFGTYDEYFKNRTFPYTFIVPEGESTAEYINQIKIELLSQSEKKYLLRFIFDRYDEIIRNSPVFNKEKVYENSLKAKLAAFIYMIGLKYNTSTNTVDTLPSFGNADREIYAVVAQNILNTIPFHNSKGRYFNGIDNQRRRSFELLNYLQAYDYLKTAKSVLQNDNVSNDAGIRELLMEFTFQLHAASNNWNQSYSRNNNLALITASAVGTAAVIFHAEGAGRLQYGRHPERWAHAAHG